MLMPSFMRLILILGVSFAFLVRLAFSAGYAGTTTAEFLKINTDPKSVSMGEGCAGIMLDNPSGALNNPAGITGVHRSKLQLNYISFIEGINLQHTSFAMPLSFGNVGFSFSYLSYGDIDGKDVNFNSISFPSSYDMLFALSYAVPIRTNIPILKEHGSVGLNVKFIRSKLAEYSAEALAADFGFIYNLPFTSGLSLGAAYKNIGSGLKYLKVANELPATITTGVGYKNYALRNLSAVVDADMPNKGPMSYSLGLSVSPMYFMDLRGGWKQTENSLMSGFRAGLGLRFGGVALDYSFSPVDQLTPVHHVSINVALGSIFNAGDAFDYYLEEHFKTAMDYYYRHDYVMAKQEFESIVSAYPEHEVSKKYIEKIEEIMSKTKEKEGERIEMLLNKADYAFAKKDYITARKHYAHILRIDQDQLKAKEGMKSVAEVLQELQFERSRQNNSKTIERLWKVATTYYKNGNFVMAKERFKDILSIDSEHKTSKEYIADIDNQLKKAAGLEINRMYDIATELFLKGKYEEALKYFEAVLLSAPHRLDAQDFVGKCKEKIVNLEADKKAQLIASQQGKVQEEVNSLFSKAEKYYERNKYEDALGLFRQCKDLCDKYEFTELSSKAGDYIAMTKTALSEYYYKEGFTYFQKNKFDNAVAAYRKSLEYDAQNTSARSELERVATDLSRKFYEQGMEYFSQGDMEEARKSFTKSLSYNPNMKESQRALERIK